MTRSFTNRTDFWGRFRNCTFLSPALLITRDDLMARVPWCSGYRLSLWRKCFILRTLCRMTGKFACSCCWWCMRSSGSGEEEKNGSHCNHKDHQPICTRCPASDAIIATRNGTWQTTESCLIWLSCGLYLIACYPIFSTFFIYRVESLDVQIINHQSELCLL